MLLNFMLSKLMSRKGREECYIGPEGAVGWLDEDKWFINV